MIATHGLTHISLAVDDPDRSLAFYRDVFGAEETFRSDTQIQAKLGMAILAWERDPAHAGTRGGIAHFGFRLLNREDIDAAVETAVRAGGRLLRRGNFAPGVPFAYVADPDGYEIEIWWE